MNITNFIDHTILKPSTVEADIEKLCEEAARANFVAVCVPPYYVALAKQLLVNTEVKIATVIGFPFGYSSTASKIAEIEQAIADGADELDMVHNIAALKNSNWHYLENELRQCIAPIHRAGKKLKLIIESGILTDAEIIQCCQVYGSLGIDFMKTSTGYAEAGASLHDVQLIRKHLPETIGIKASGGIRTFAFAKELIDAGATRIGCSASVKILEESKALV